MTIKFYAGLMSAWIRTACQLVARIFADLGNPESEVSKLMASGEAHPRLEEQGAKPSVFYIDSDEQFRATFSRLRWSSV
jgi:Fe-S-cluster-containing dehydrogenase component